MFRNILISAGLAGLFAALLLTLLQTALITPLILQAENFEEAAGHHDDAPHAHAGEHAAHAHDHHHDAAEWKPDDGLERTLFTLTSNAVMGVGYALLLVGIYTLWRRPVGHLQGLLFGLAGFAVFFVAPGLGLPPELPGTEAAELGARQQWWLFAASGSAIGLALLFLQKNIALRILGAALVVVPHLAGAPHPAAAGSLAPAALQQEFRYATLAGNAVFWLALGLVSAAAFRKFAGGAADAADS
jgi:cobalt transporter subunit CbtA